MIRAAKLTRKKPRATRLTKAVGRTEHGAGTGRVPTSRITLGCNAENYESETYFDTGVIGREEYARKFSSDLLGADVRAELGRRQQVLARGERNVPGGVGAEQSTVAGGFGASRRNDAGSSETAVGRRRIQILRWRSSNRPRRRAGPENWARWSVSLWLGLRHDAFAALGFPENADLLFRRVSFAFHGLGSF
jgi:hypothetical protein